MTLLPNQARTHRNQLMTTEYHQSRYLDLHGIHHVIAVCETVDPEKAVVPWDATHIQRCNARMACGGQSSVTLVAVAGEYLKENRGLTR